MIARMDCPKCKWALRNGWCHRCKVLVANSVRARRMRNPHPCKGRTDYYFINRIREVLRKDPIPYTENTTQLERFRVWKDVG